MYHQRDAARRAFRQLYLDPLDLSYMAEVGASSRHVIGRTRRYPRCQDSGGKYRSARKELAEEAVVKGTKRSVCRTFPRHVFEAAFG